MENCPNKSLRGEQILAALQCHDIPVQTKEFMKRTQNNGDLA